MNPAVPLRIVYLKTNLMDNGERPDLPYYHSGKYLESAFHYLLHDQAFTIPDSLYFHK